MRVVIAGDTTPADTGLTMTAYTAAPGSASNDSLTLLAGWAATLERPDGADTTRATDGRDG